MVGHHCCLTKNLLPTAPLLLMITHFVIIFDELIYVNSKKVVSLLQLRTKKAHFQNKKKIIPEMASRVCFLSSVSSI